MNRLAWIIIFSVILASAAAVVGVVVVAYKRPYMPANLRQSPQGKAPAETVVTDERILRLEVQLKSSDQETRLGAMFELAGLAEDNPERLGPVLLRALDAARRISGRSFLPGERGRRAALKYWDERNKPPEEPGAR